MSKPMISVQNLGKKYILNHQTSGKRPQYLRLSEEIGEKARNIFKRKSAQEIAARHEEFWALDDVSFDVIEGEVVGIIGRNGAGKSTLLKLLSRITDPTKGRFELNGRVAALLEVGTGFHPELTGRENIFLNGAVLGMHRSEIRSKFDEIVEFSGVEKFLDTPVKRFSSGMQTRLAFSVAAHLDPEILIIDEVLAVGDAAFQKKCLTKIREVSGSGRTVLFVSHNLATVSSLTTRCVYLKDGKVALDAPSAEAIRAYADSSGNESSEYSAPHDRSGTYVQHVKLHTSLGPAQHRMNDPISIEIVVNIDEPISNACLQCIIVDNQRQVATSHFHLISDTNIAFGREKGRYVLRCNVPRLRLFMGSYSLVIHLREPAGGRKFDFLQEICHFSVDPIDSQRTMLPYAAGEATYIEDWQWNVEAI